MVNNSKINNYELSWLVDLEGFEAVLLFTYYVNGVIYIYSC